MLHTIQGRTPKNIIQIMAPSAARIAIQAIFSNPSGVILGILLSLCGVPLDIDRKNMKEVMTLAMCSVACYVLFEPYAS